MIIVISNLGKCLQSLYKKCFFQNYIKEIALTCKLHKAYMTQCSSAFTLLLHCFVFIPFTLPPALSYSNIHTWGTLSIVSLTDTHMYAQNSVIRRYSVFHSFALKSLLNSHLSFLSCWCKCMPFFHLYMFMYTVIFLLLIFTYFSTVTGMFNWDASRAHTGTHTLYFFSYESTSLCLIKD